MIKAVVSNGFIKNCISTASKKCKKKGLPHYFNATAPPHPIRDAESSLSAGEYSGS